MQQAIIWTSAGPIHLRIYAALRGDELIFQFVRSFGYLTLRKSSTSRKYKIVWSMFLDNRHFN